MDKIWKRQLSVLVWTMKTELSENADVDTAMWLCRSPFSITDPKWRMNCWLCYCACWIPCLEINVLILKINALISSWWVLERPCSNGNGWILANRYCLQYSSPCSAYLHCLLGFGGENVTKYYYILTPITCLTLIILSLEILIPKPEDKPARPLLRNW